MGLVFRDSGVHLRARAIVHSQLEGDDDVVLHASDLAAKGNALLAETVCCLLELKRVDFHLLLYTAARSSWILAEEWVVKGDTLVAEHVIKKCHHAVLDLLCCQNAVAVC